MFGCVKTVLFITVLVAIVGYGIKYWLDHSKYIFSESDIIKIAKKHIAPSPADPSETPGAGVNMKRIIASIHKDFSALYPHHILPKEDLQFVFFSAGGWTGTIFLLHASLKEFVLVFGTAIDTYGHSGRYLVNRTDIVLTGEFLEWNEGQFKAKTVKAGDVARHSWGEAYVLNYKANMWKVSYGRGFILSGLPFTLADVIFGNQDYVSVYYMLKIHLKSIFKEFMYCVAHPGEIF